VVAENSTKQDPDTQKDGGIQPKIRRDIEALKVAFVVLIPP